MLSIFQSSKNKYYFVNEYNFYNCGDQLTHSVTTLINYGTLSILTTT
jgi:hypothetical protein